MAVSASGPNSSSERHSSSSGKALIAAVTPTLGIHEYGMDWRQIANPPGGAA
jgi:hypothetical protein